MGNKAAKMNIVTFPLKTHIENENLIGSDRTDCNSFVKSCLCQSIIQILLAVKSWAANGSGTSDKLITQDL